MIVKTSSEKETFELAYQVGQHLKGGDVLCLTGNLGSGKTTFVKGLAKFFGIKNHVVSPTFLILKNYKVRPTKKHPIKNFVHIDAYRIEDAKEMFEVGLQNYIGQKDILLVIEWAEKIKSVLPSRRAGTRKISIKIKIGSGESRIFTVTGLN